MDKLSKQEKEILQECYRYSVVALQEKTSELLERFDELCDPKKYILQAIDNYETKIVLLEEAYTHWIYMFRSMATDPVAMNRLYFDIHKDSIANEIEYYHKQIHSLRFKIAGKTPKGEIGAKEIARAKAVPLGELLPFNSAGFTKCTFHNENHGSMKWYRKDNRFACFGCGKSGDSVDIVMKSQGCSFIDAIKFLIRK